MLTTYAMGNKLYKKKTTQKSPFTYEVNILVERDRKYTSNQVKKIVSKSDKCIKEK